MHQLIRIFLRDSYSPLSSDLKQKKKKGKKKGIKTARSRGNPISCKSLLILIIPGQVRKRAASFVPLLISEPRVGSPTNTLCSSRPRTTTSGAVARVSAFLRLRVLTRDSIAQIYTLCSHLQSVAFSKFPEILKTSLKPSSHISKSSDSYKNLRIDDSA